MPPACVKSLASASALDFYVTSISRADIANNFMLINNAIYVAITFDRMSPRTILDTDVIHCKIFY